MPPIRDIVLTLLILGLLPYCLQRPWIGILTWNWLGMMNPHRLTYGFAFHFPFAMLVGACTLFGYMTTRDKKPIPWNRELVLMVVLVAYFTFTSFFAWAPLLVWDAWFKFFKVILMAIIGTALIYGRDRITWLLTVVALSLGFYGFKGGIWTILTGGGNRVQGPEGGLIGGNTFIGLALLMVVPVLMALARQETRKWWKRMFLSVAALSILATIFTYSRGALVGLAVVLPMVFLRMKRKFLVAVLLVPTILIAIPLVPEGLYKRADTIGTYQQDDSSMQRIQSWIVAWNIAKESPLTGAGFDFDLTTSTITRWRAHAGPDLDRYVSIGLSYAAHSIYFQLLGQHGFVGFGLWLMLMLFTLASLQRLKREHAKQPEHEWIANYASAIQIGLFGYLVSGAFLSSGYFDVVYVYITFVAILGREGAAIKAAARKTMSAAATESPKALNGRLVA